MLDHPRYGLGYPITKKANPRYGIIAVSRSTVQTSTAIVIGKSRVNWRQKQAPCAENLCFLFLIAVMIDTSI